MRAFTNSVLRLTVIAAFALMVPQSVLHAQERGTVGTANIPFAFQVGAYHYAAGTYRVELQDNLLMVHGKTGSGLMEVRWESTNQPSRTSKLVFHHYGDRYFLREMQVGDSSVVLISGRSKEERQAQREETIAGNRSTDLGQEPHVEIAMAGQSR